MIHHIKIKYNSLELVFEYYGFLHGASSGLQQSRSLRHHLFVAYIKKPIPELGLKSMH